jgi:hypothetical protein
MLRQLKRKTWFRSWKFGIGLNVALATAVLAVNLGITIWALSQSETTDDDNRRALFRGDCAQVKKVNTAGHLVINTLSTILLSASNYTMQCLSAPSREDVDSVHKQQQWLNIGTHSMKNLRNLPTRHYRRWLWCILLLSSLPLHIL